MRAKLCALTLATSVAASASASTPAAYAELDQRVIKACAGAAGLARSRVLADKLAFSDAIPVELRVVQGFNKRGKYQRMVCAYDRRTRKVEVQEATGRLGTARLSGSASSR